MKHLAYRALEELINRALDLDPQAKEQLIELKGHLVALEITDRNLKWVLEITDQGISFRRDEPDSIDATISGPLLGILQTACDGGSPSTMRKTGLRLEGDIQLAESLKNILAGLDMDWEAPLANCVGPTVAGGIGMGVEQLLRFTKKTLSAGKVQLATYLKTDSGCLPSEQEVQHFNRTVTVLRHDVERLEARINHLRANRKDINP